jgi:hypothetical protein
MGVSFDDAVFVPAATNTIFVLWRFNVVGAGGARSLKEAPPVRRKTGG